MCMIVNFLRSFVFTLGSLVVKYIHFWDNLIWLGTCNPNLTDINLHQPGRKELI